MAEPVTLTLVCVPSSPTVDLEFIRNHVNAIPAERLEAAAMAAWTAVKMGFSQDVAHSLYVVACAMSRLADERLLEALPL